MKKLLAPFFIIFIMKKLKLKEKFTFSRGIELIFIAVIYIFALAVSSSSAASVIRSNYRRVLATNILNDKIAPYSKLTLENISLLPGRYAVTKSVPSVDPNSSEYLGAASNVILEISRPDKKGIYTFTYDSFLDGKNNDKKISKVQMKLEKKNNIPVFYDIKAKKESRKGTYIAFNGDAHRYLWVIFDEREQKSVSLYPLNGDWLPAGVLNGEWKEKITGSSFVFSDETMRLSSNGEELVGRYALEDNRMYFEFPNGAEGLYYVAYNPDSQQLVLTKIANDGMLRAMALERTDKAPVQTQAPQITYQQKSAPEQEATPQYESDFEEVRKSVTATRRNLQIPMNNAGEMTADSINNTLTNESERVYENARVPGLPQKTQPVYRSETTMTPKSVPQQKQTQNSNSQYQASQPDSEPEFEDETFTGTFEYRNNEDGLSFVWRFKNDGRFVWETKYKGLLIPVTGNYRLNGDIVTLFYDDDSSTSDTMTIDRKNNTLTDELGLVYVGASAPIWKQKQQSDYPPEQSKTAYLAKNPPAPTSQTQTAQSKPEDNINGYYYCANKDLMLHLGNGWCTIYSNFGSYGQSILMNGRITVDGNSVTLNLYSRDGRYNPINNPLVVEMTADRKNGTLKSLSGLVFNRVENIAQFVTQRNMNNAYRY